MADEKKLSTGGGDYSRRKGSKLKNATEASSRWAKATMAANADAAPF